MAATDAAEGCRMIGVRSPLGVRWGGLYPTPHAPQMHHPPICQIATPAFRFNHQALTLAKKLAF